MENQADTGQTAPAKPRRITRWVVAGAVALVVAGGAGIAVATDNGPGMRGHGMMHGGFGGRFMERGVDRVLDEVDATEDQKDRIWKIIDETRAELMPVGREMRAMRGEVMELLTQPTIDRAAAEALRAERIATLDATTRKVTESLLEAAEILTPEQRAQIAEHVKQRGERRW